MNGKHLLIAIAITVCLFADANAQPPQAGPTPTGIAIRIGFRESVPTVSRNAETLFTLSLAQSHI